LLYTENENTAMRSALAKRALHDISDLAAYIKKQDCSAGNEIDILHIVRTKILNILFELKKN
jgi:cytochrome c553